MAVQKRFKHVSGLKELDALLDGLTDEKFRKAALRAAAKKTLAPVAEVLKSKLPSGSSSESSYSHYESYTGKKGYNPGDLRNGVKTSIKLNTGKDIKTDRNGNIRDGQRSELQSAITFDSHVYKLASILENGRSKRVAQTNDGKVFHMYGKATDKTHRDIGTTEPRNFVSSTFAQCETAMTENFKHELTQSITQQAKRLQRKKAKEAKNARG